jgi:uncharacterized protein YlxP (DUF503 family)
MIIAIIKISIYAPWVHSLKEKRMEVKSLCAKVSNKFNVSVAEVDKQDKHQIIVLGVAGVAGDTVQADSIIEHVLNYIELITEGEIIKVEREVI